MNDELISLNEVLSDISEALSESEYKFVKEIYNKVCHSSPLDKEDIDYLILEIRMNLIDADSKFIEKIYSEVCCKTISYNEDSILEIKN